MAKFRVKVEFEAVIESEAHAAAYWQLLKFLFRNSEQIRFRAVYPLRSEEEGAKS